MKKLNIVLLSLCLLVSSLASAQATSSNLKTELLPITLSSYGINVFSPGIKIGVDYPLAEVVKQRVKRNSKTKTVSKLWYLNGSLAIAAEPTSNTNWLTSLEIGRMRTRNDKCFASPTFGFGALVRFNNGDSHELVDGEVIDRGVTSRTYFAPSLGLSFGRNFQVNDLDFGLYGRGNGVMAVGMNNTTLPILSFELGIRCTPSFSFSKAMHHIKKVTK